MTTSSFVDVAYGGRTVSIEYLRLTPSARTAPDSPLVVFLHEGLGSIGLWRDYPQQFCDEGGYRGLVFSREGYGRSTPRAHDQHWPPTFMHEQATEMLPQLFARLGIGNADPAWLFGHSDGASIALIFAATFPASIAGVIAVAPHIFVEAISVGSVRGARTAYSETDLRERLARYHDDPDSAFNGWTDAWLNPAFLDWNIEAELDAITCPVFALQGEDDEYGTLEQIRGIARRLPKTRLLAIPECGHSPQRDQPELLIREAGRFILEHPST